MFKKENIKFRFKNSIVSTKAKKTLKKKKGGKIFRYLKRQKSSRSKQIVACMLIQLKMFALFEINEEVIILAQL